MGIPNTPVVPYEDPDQSPITTQPATTPWVSTWWDYQTINEIPQDSVGWLAAQGWQETDITYDQTTKPPTPYFVMSRNSLNNTLVLQSLLGEWTFAYNSALKNNNDRYNEVLVDWDDMIRSSQTHFGEQVSAQNEHAVAYLTDLGAAMDSVKVLIDNNETKLIADVTVATTALGELNTKLSDLEDNYDTSFVIIDGLLSDQAGFLSTFLVDFIAKRDELDTNYTDHLAVILTLLGDADTDLSTFAGEQGSLLAELSAEYTAHVSQLTALLATATTFLDTVETDINDVLVDIDADYTDVDTEVTALLASGTSVLATHKGDYDSVLALLESDFVTHSPTATAFLDDLGVTERARINEKFTASLATQLQQLTDRGLYSGAVAIDVTARNTRDHNEEIVALNDRLNREKFDNQHQLYGQQTAMRTGTMAGKDRIYGLQQELFRYQASEITGLHGLQQSMRDRTMAGKQAIYAIKDANNRLNIEVRDRLYDSGQALRRVLIDEAARLQTLSQAVTQFKTGQRDRLLEQVQRVVTEHLTGLDRQHTAEQSVSGAAISERNTLLQQLQDAVRGELTGKERFAALTSQNASTLTEQRHRMVVERMSEIMARVDGGQKKHEEDMALMAYQLTERNTLLVGLFGFVERRDDIGPSISDMSTLITSLGDSGGGWISP